MFRISAIIGSLGLLVVGLLFVTGCSPSKPAATPEQMMPSKSTDPKTTAKNDAKPDTEHDHKTGSHGGMIVSLGRDSYHVEAIVTGKGEVRLHTLGNDESRVIDIESQTLTAYVKPDGASEAITVEVKPEPQPGDAEGRASLFVAQLPENLVSKKIDVTIPNITIGGERFRMAFSNKAELHAAEAMPGKVADEAERKLYLTPGGLYSVADIEANGNKTASQKFAGFMASHDLKPKVGDKICPITLTKANPECTWTVGGKKYEFCCPPCVDEFVALAKTKPEEIKAPEEYVKRDAAISESK